MAKTLQFKISAALKDIIGKDLIPDDYIAVFELVKNSYDAHATSVDVIFKNLYSQDAQIIIKDNGKGMNRNDLINKWLFVAYSAKKEGTEDIDYRSRINQIKIFAGAKGIGRFSCDRLGKRLVLETTKEGEKTEVLRTDWELFEKSMKAEFKEIEVDYSRKNTNSFNLKSGTILFISDLRSSWDRPKLLKLKDSLAKLIAPKQDNQKEKFKINLIVEEEIENDKKENDERLKVNGPIQNFIFETLGLKTTKIEAEISSDGTAMTTSLYDGGTLIYRIKETRPDKELHNIHITIYYLNQSAKMTFAKRMGLASRLYGNIFLYKNGFRVYPFGEPSEDPLKIDERKSRKQYSRLGISELMGQIDIYGENPDLKETSSRGNGLIETDTYNKLKDCFLIILERLEKYVVDVQEWGLSIEEKLDEYDENKLHNKITELIKDLTSSKDIIEFEYNLKIIDILQKSQNNSAQAIISNLKRIANKSNNNSLIAETLKLEKKLNKLRLERNESERAANEIKTKLIEKETQNLFLKSIRSQELDDVLNLMHQIGISTSSVQNYIRGIVYRLDNREVINREEFKEMLGKINIEINKIYSISRFATKANFKVSVKPVKTDIKAFIREYLSNIVKPFLPAQIKLIVSVDNETPFYKEIRPLELIIIIDNLISNSRKAKAKLISVTLTKSQSNSLIISFEDNGIGVNTQDIDKLFDYGYTTTDGSGLGLTHVSEILKSWNSSIRYNSKNKINTEFIITINQF